MIRRNPPQRRFRQNPAQLFGALRRKKGDPTTESNQIMPPSSRYLRSFARSSG